MPFLIRDLLICVVANLAVDATPPADERAFAPSLFKDHSGVLLVWAEPVRTTPAATRGSSAEPWAIRMSRFDKDGWSEPHTVRQSIRESLFLNWADLPTIARGKDDRIIVTWLPMVGQGTYAYHIVGASSDDGGQTWKSVGRLHDDRSATEHGFVSMVAQPDGEVRAFWLDGRKMARSQSANHAAGHEHGAGDMSLRTALIGHPSQGTPKSLLLDGKVCECCGTDAVMTPTGSVVVYRDRSDDEVRDIWLVREDSSAEGGWTKPAPVHVDGWQIAACPVNGPAIDAENANLVVAWYTGAEERPGVHASFGSGSRFQKPITVDDRSLGRVDVVMLDGGQEAIVSSIVPVIGSGQLQLHRVGADGSVGKPYNVAKVDGGRPSGFPKITRVGDGELLVVWTKPAKRKGGPLGLEAARIPLADIPQVSSGQS